MKKLRRPYPIHIVLTQQEAHRILTFFFEKGNVNLSALQLLPTDREFAQALLIEGVEATAKLTFVVDVIETLKGGNIGSIKDLIKALAKLARKYGHEGWFRYADDDDLKDPKIARTVHKTMRRNLKSAWQGRVQDGDTIWNHVHG